MALRQSCLPQRLQHRGTVPQQPQLIGNGALADAQQTGSLLLAHAPVVQQAADPCRLLHKIQILPLEIFDHSRHGGFLLIHAHYDAGDLCQPRLHTCPQPPLSCDQLIAVAHPPDGQRLQDAVLADGVGQLLQRILLKYPARLGGVGLNGPGGDEDDPSGLHVGFQFLAMHCPSSFVNVPLSF